MKFANKYLFIAAGAALFSSCAKDLSNKVTFDGGTAPVLTSTATDSIPLPVTDTTSNAVTFSWTNPNYTFSDGISSQDVTYYLNFDTVSGFNSSVMQTVSISSSLSQTFTVSVLNALLANQMGLVTGMQHTIYVEVQSFIQPYSSGSAPAGLLSSSTLTYTVVPYSPPPTVAPPASGTLYITGSATYDGWMAGTGPTDTTLQNQQLTETANNIWSITLPMIGGQQFLLVPVLGSWSNKYATNSSSTSTTGGTFSYNASNNFYGPANTGTYTVTFNFQTGNYTITPAP